MTTRQPRARRADTCSTAEAAVTAELTLLGELVSSEGQLAVALARMVDLAQTGATVGAAANAKQCEALLEKLRARALGQKRTALDELSDELAKRRKDGRATPARRARSS